jgi:hypothetical protein
MSLMQARPHQAPAGVLRCLRRIESFVSLQPEAEPVGITLIGSQLVLGLELDDYGSLGKT